MNRQERQESQEWRGSIKNRQNCPALPKYTQSYLLILACGALCFYTNQRASRCHQTPAPHASGQFCPGGARGVTHLVRLHIKLV